MLLRDANPDGFAEILRMNQESVQFLSPMDAVRLIVLHEMAAYHRVLSEGGRACAFLLAMREACDYDSPNLSWFTERYDQFLYVDRVVISADQQGRGLGPMLYADLLSFARAVALVHCQSTQLDVRMPARCD